MSEMRAITIKLPAAMLSALREEARATGRSIGELVRERLAATPSQGNAGSVYAVTSDLAGSLAGSARSATNDRARFRRK
jgi:hypothetical protein